MPPEHELTTVSTNKSVVRGWLLLAMTANLTVAVAHRPPYVFDKGGQYPLDQRFEGLLVDLLPRLLSETNITLPFHYLPARDNEGGTLINATAGIWNGAQTNVSPDS